ncbi:MAG: cell division protein FtsI, partial [Lachnospiraceae bacterium]|nr:cell division protein FtsI [Candidatus Equihabitans merdae]
SEEVSDELRRFMKASVDDGTSVYSKVDGYSMGGKTGTAQKLPRGNGKYLVSFIGFAPYDNPQVLIYVVIDEPNVAEQADSRFPQWVAKAILENVLPYMNIFPDEALTGGNPDLEEPDVWSGQEGQPDTDTVEDTNVPGIEGDVNNNPNPNGGNTPQDNGMTNEEAAAQE